VAQGQGRNCSSLRIAAIVLMQMQRNSFCFCLQFLFWVASCRTVASGQEVPRVLREEVSARMADLAAQGIHQYYSLDFEGGMRSFEIMLKEFPNHPAGYLCMAGLIEAKMIMERQNEDEEEMYEYLEKSLKLCQAEIQAGRKASGYFFQGGALGYRGLHKWRRKEHLGAFRDGTAGVRSLKMAVKLDPQLHDAFYGLGLYEYYKAKYSKTFSFIPFIRDTREEGIKMLMQCMEKGLFSAAAARVALMRIFLEEGRMEEAEKIGDWVVDAYPLYWDAHVLKASVFRERDQPREAIPFLEQAIRVLEERLPTNVYDRIRLQFELAGLYEELEESQQAVNLYRSVVEDTSSGDPDTVRDINAFKRKASHRLRSLGFVPGSE